MPIQKFLVDLQLSGIFGIPNYTRVWQPTAGYVEMLLKTSTINTSQTLGFEDVFLLLMKKYATICWPLIEYLNLTVMAV